MPTRNDRRPEKGYRWILEGSTLQNQWLMRIVTLGIWPNTIGEICYSKIYSFRIWQNLFTGTSTLTYTFRIGQVCFTTLKPLLQWAVVLLLVALVCHIFKKSSLIIWVHDGSWYWLEDWNLTLWAAEISQHFSTGRFKQVHCSAMTGSAAKCPGAPFYTHNAWELYEPKVVWCLFYIGRLYPSGESDLSDSEDDTFGILGPIVVFVGVPSCEVPTQSTTYNVFPACSGWLWVSVLFLKDSWRKCMVKGWTGKFRVQRGHLNYGSDITSTSSWALQQFLHDFEFPSSAGLQLPEKLEGFKRTRSKRSEHDW